MLLLYVKVQKGGGSARMRRSSPTQRRCKMSAKDRKVLRVHCNEETCQNPNVRPYLGVVAPGCHRRAAVVICGCEAVIHIYPHLTENQLGGGARREGRQDGTWCTHVAPPGPDNRDSARPGPAQGHT